MSWFENAIENANLVIACLFAEVAQYKMNRWIEVQTYSKTGQRWLFVIHTIHMFLHILEYTCYL